MKKRSINCCLSLLALALPQLVQASGGFADVKSFGVGTNPRSLAVGDFNGDGKPDMVVANFASNTVSVLIGNGDGTFQAAVNYSTGSSPYAS